MPATTAPEDHQSSLTVAEAARRLDVHPDTIRRWADAGRLPCWRTPTQQRRFRVEDVEAVLAGGRASADQDGDE